MLLAWIQEMCLTLDLLVGQEVELQVEIELAAPAVEEILVDEWVYLDC